jgi:hypothetical protein
MAPGQILFHGHAGNGFFYLRTDCAATTQWLLVQTPHLFPGGTALYQPWVKGFNPSRPLGVYIPTWISLVGLPLEYIKFAGCIASVVGKVLWEEASASCDSPPRFCVGLDLTQGWISAVLAYSPADGHAIIHIEYDSVQLHCQRCHSHQHSQEACPHNQTPLATQDRDSSGSRHRPVQTEARSSERDLPRGRSRQGRRHQSQNFPRNRA